MTRMVIHFLRHWQNPFVYIFSLVYVTSYPLILFVEFPFKLTSDFILLLPLDLTDEYNYTLFSILLKGRQKKSVL